MTRRLGSGPRPMVWRAPWPRFLTTCVWHSDCGIRNCSYAYNGDSLVEVADDMRHHVTDAHPSWSPS